MVGAEADGPGFVFDDEPEVVDVLAVAVEAGQFRADRSVAAVRKRPRGGAFFARPVSGGRAELEFAPVMSPAPSGTAVPFAVANQVAPPVSARASGAAMKTSTADFCSLAT